MVANVTLPSADAEVDARKYDDEKGMNKRSYLSDFETHSFEPWIQVN